MSTTKKEEMSAYSDMPTIVNIRRYSPFDGLDFWRETGGAVVLDNEVQPGFHVLTATGRTAFAEGEEIAEPESDATYRVRHYANTAVYIENAEHGTRPRRGDVVRGLVSVAVRWRPKLKVFRTMGEYRKYLEQATLSLHHHGFRHYTLHPGATWPTAVSRPFTELEGAQRMYWRKYPKPRVANIELESAIRKDVRGEWLRDTRGQRFGRPLFGSAAPVMTSHVVVTAEFSPYSERRQLRQLQRRLRSKTLKLHWAHGTRLAEKIGTLLAERSPDPRGRSLRDALLAHVAASPDLAYLHNADFARLVYGYRMVNSNERVRNGAYLLRRDGKLFHVTYSCVYRSRMVFRVRPHARSHTVHIRVKDVFGPDWSSDYLYAYLSSSGTRVPVTGPYVSVSEHGALSCCDAVNGDADVAQREGGKGGRSFPAHTVYFVRVKNCFEDLAHLNILFPGAGALRGTLRPRGEYIVDMCEYFSEE